MRQRGILTLEQKDLLMLARNSTGDEAGQRCREFVSQLAGLVGHHYGDEGLQEFADALGMPWLYETVERMRA